MIIKATFKCERHGIEADLFPQTDDSGLLPDGWGHFILHTVGPPRTAHFCTFCMADFVAFMQPIPPPTEPTP